MDDIDALSIIVPTLNEAENIPKLIERIDKSLTSASIIYEIIIIDDQSQDNTVEVAKELAKKFNIRVFEKVGKPGKSYSLMEGFSLSAYPIVVMIDADLQYEPEEIVPMYRLLTNKNADVVVTRRKHMDVPAIRKLSSTVYNLIFTRLMFGIDFDTQSGLKLFRKSVLSKFTLSPSPWSFDLEFLVKSLENRFKIISHDIKFEKRAAGKTKVNMLKATIELARSSIILRSRTSIGSLKNGKRTKTNIFKYILPVLIVAFLIIGVGQVYIGSTSAMSTLKSSNVKSDNTITNYTPSLYKSPAIELTNHQTNNLLIGAGASGVIGILLFSLSLVYRSDKPHNIYKNTDVENRL